MSVDNFIPTLWNDQIFRGYDKALVFGQLANRSYEGQIKGFGDSVRVNEIGDMTPYAYTGTVTYTEAEDAQKVLLIDNKYVISKKLDDVDRIQAKGNLMAEIGRKMGAGMGSTIDASIAALHAQAGIKDGTTASPDEVLSTTILRKISEMGQAMDENNVPADGRVAVVHPWFIQKLRLAGITQLTDNTSVYTNGSVGNVLGFDMFMSNNCSNTSSTWYANYFFRQGDSLALAEQFMDLEAIRLESVYGDGLRQLAVWGVKVMAPESFGVMYNTNGAT